MPDFPKTYWTITLSSRWETVWDLDALAKIFPGARILTDGGVLALGFVEPASWPGDPASYYLKEWGSTARMIQIAVEYLLKIGVTVPDELASWNPGMNLTLDITADDGHEKIGEEKARLCRIAGRAESLRVQLTHLVRETASRARVQ